MAASFAEARDTSAARVDAAWQSINRARKRCGGLERIPRPYIDLLAARLAREQAVERALDRAEIVDPGYARDAAALQERIEADSTDRARRRQAELELADYIESVAHVHPSSAEYFGLSRLVERMRACRQSGTVGLRPDGGYVVVWDQKCDQVRLCPDEAREETRRVAERYVPFVLSWLREKPTRRLFWLVLTDRNVPTGQLAEGKKAAWERFRSHIWKGKYHACPLERRGRGYARTRRRTMPKFPGVKGALVVQEDPLSAAGDWNVHLNALLLVDGPLDYRELRQEWGRNLEIREVRERDAAGLRAAVAELVKYAALAVPTKSAEKRASGQTRAPAMVEWPTERWLEWWAAQRGSRRTRSYGVLYGVPSPPTVPLDEVQWIGTLHYAGGYYRANVAPPPRSAEGVDSIPGNNFSASGPWAECSQGTGPGPPTPPGGACLN